MKRQCMRFHQDGQSELIGICTNVYCQSKLICTHCIKDYHFSHQAEIVTFPQLGNFFWPQINEINQCVQNIEETEAKFMEAKKKLLMQMDHYSKHFRGRYQLMFGQLMQIHDLLKEVQNADATTINEELVAKALPFKYFENWSHLKFKIQADQTYLATNVDTINALESQLNDQLRKDSGLELIYKYIKEQALSQFYIANFIDYSKVPEECQHYRGIMEQLSNESGTIIYLGETSESKRYGRGMEIDSVEQVIKEGIWFNNQLQWGQITDKDENAMYRIKQGHFRSDLIQGFAKMIRSDGMVFKGPLINNKREGKGRCKFISGTYQGASFVGHYKNDKADGDGTYCLANGNREVGTYCQGVSIGEHLIYKPNNRKPSKTIKYDNYGRVLSEKQC